MDSQSLPVFMEKSVSRGEITRRGDRRRLIGIALFLLLAFILAYSLNYPSLNAIRGDVRQIGFLAPIMFILVYAIATLFFVPKNLLSIAAGGVFGMIPGTLFVVAGATIGSIIAFVASRRIGRLSVERLAGRKISQIDARLSERPFVGILLARLIPIVPFTLLNYAAGLSAVGFSAYLGATVLGMLPGTASYVALGAYGIHLRSWEFIVAVLAFLGFFFLLRKLAKRTSV